MLTCLYARLHLLRRRPALGGMRFTCTRHADYLSSWYRTVISGIHMAVCRAADARYRYRQRDARASLQKLWDLKEILNCCSIACACDLAGACRATCREEQTHCQVGFACGWRVRPAPA